MIAIRLLCNTIIYAKTFRISESQIYISDIKYTGEDMPAFIEDDMLINKDAIEVYFVNHSGGKNEVSED